MGEIKSKKGLIQKTWQRCRSFGSSKKVSATTLDHTTSIIPHGSFSVYVGAQKQRFIIKTACINHPLFQMLLEEAEMEYGYNCEGPLELPCDVDIFYRVLSEIEDDSDEIRQGCTFAKGYGSYQLMTPSRYQLMTPSRYQLMTPSRLVGVISY